MRYGSSGNLTATQPNKTGIETIEKLKKFGYDYIELPLSEIMDLPPEQREAIVTRVEASGIKSEVYKDAVFDTNRKSLLRHISAEKGLK